MKEQIKEIILSRCQGNEHLEFDKSELNNICDEIIDLKQEWISINNESPEEYELILVSYGYGGDDINIDVVKYYSGWFHCLDKNEEIDQGSIYAWCKFPKPLKNSINQIKN